MKLKGILIIVAVLCAAIIIAYFIPSENIIIDKKIYIKTTVNSTKKYIIDVNKWNQWWPKNKQQPPTTSDNRSFIYKTTSYTPTKPMYNSVNITVDYKDKTYNGNLIILPISKDSILLDWVIELSKNSSLLKKIFSSKSTKEIETNTAELLYTIKNFLEDNLKIYQIPINQVTVTDTILISTKFSSTVYPSNQLIYQNIEKLQHYVTENNAVQTNPPMLHIIQDSGFYQSMVALPINKKIADSDKFLTKKMYPGKILVTEVKGGINSTRHAMGQLELFISDYSIGSPAIPFESLITNRIQETDSTKWITRLYYPIY